MREIGEAIIEKYKSCLIELVWDGLDLDKILDCRDLPPFDDLWVEKYQFISEKIKLSPLPAKEILKIDSLREFAFKCVYNQTHSSDLSACVSDDLELILNFYAIDIDDIAIENLSNAYLNKTFPYTIP